MPFLRRGFDYKKYWQDRYKQGGNSGAGSYGEHAEYKAAVVNDILREHGVHSVLEFGCGDGNQLQYMNYEEYVGLDISREAVRRCRAMFASDKTKRFKTYSPRRRLSEGVFDATISLEVLMHIVDEAEFVATLDLMFEHSRDIVILQAPLVELLPYVSGSHELHRELLPYLEAYPFTILDVIVHPSVTYQDRLAGVIGAMSSDFVILKRDVGAI